MLDDIFLAIWFLLPAACANVAPIISAKLPLFNRWNTPLDGGKKYKGNNIFGPNKTWRGLLSGIIIATLVLFLQKLAIADIAWIAAITDAVDYESLPLLLLGPLFGIGALGGDAIESFFKRRRGIPSGEKWIPFDQLDYIIGGVLVSLLFVVLAPIVYVWMFVVWFIAHLLASYVGWLLHFKDSPI